MFVARPKNGMVSDRHDTDRKHQETIDENSAQSVCPRVLKTLEQRKRKQEEIEDKILYTYKTSWNHIYSDTLYQNVELGYLRDNKRVEERVRRKFLKKNLIRIESEDNPDEIIFTPKKPDEA
ncbi:MAG: hypothetical protein WAM14_11760 [Candidatus Nitrosopolaris sp.]